jgi:hypothetical protein
MIQAPWPESAAGGWGEAWENGLSRVPHEPYIAELRRWQTELNRV